jgi:hypothetical protein
MKRRSIFQSKRAQKTDLWVVVTFLGIIATRPVLRAENNPSVSADPKITAAMMQVSAARIQANIEKLVSFQNRSTRRIRHRSPLVMASARHGSGSSRSSRAIREIAATVSK